MSYKIEKLIENRDIYEIVRDKIALILIEERDKQIALATTALKNADDWDFDVYVERTNALDISEDDNGIILQKARVNIVFDGFSLANGNNSASNQQLSAKFNIDVYGHTQATWNETTKSAVHSDTASSFSCHRVSRLVRKILMYSGYQYLSLEGVVLNRMVTSSQIFLPSPAENMANQNIVAQRLILEVLYNEKTIENDLSLLEQAFVSMEVNENGLVELLYDYT